MNPTELFTRPRLGRLLLLAAITAASAASAAGIAPPPELQGTYAPFGNCTLQPKLTLDAAAITILAAGRTTRLAPLDACFSCAGGARYEGIEIWVSQTDAAGNPKEPIFRFNADEKKGEVVVDRGGMQAYPAAHRAVAMASPLRRCAK